MIIFGQVEEPIGWIDRGAWPLSALSSVSDSDVLLHG